MGEGDGAVNIFVDVLYGVAESVTGMVGLTPLQVCVGIGGLLVVLLLYGGYTSIRGKTSFTLDD